VWTANSGDNNPNKQLTITTTAGDFAFWVKGFGLNVPNNLIVDTTVSPNLVWVANNGTGGVSRIVNNGTSSLTGTAVAGGGQQDQLGITLDANGDVWVSNTTGGSVTKITGSTGVVALGPIAVGGINSTSQPRGIAADSQNTVWVNNFNGNSVTQLDTNGNALSPAGGFTAGGLINGPMDAVAIDRSGNVWVVNHGNNTVTELVGASFGPVATPIASGRVLLP
jgi:streptogramin lyase